MNCLMVPLIGYPFPFSWPKSFLRFMFTFTLLSSFFFTLFYSNTWSITIVNRYVNSISRRSNRVKKNAKWIKNKPGPALIYCDGGNKPEEFRNYAAILRTNDFIAAHDWDYGGYHRAEIRPRDIEKAVVANDLTPIGFRKPIRICLWRKVVQWKYSSSALTDILAIVWCSILHRGATWYLALIILRGEFG